MLCCWCVNHSCTLVCWRLTEITSKTQIHMWIFNWNFSQKSTLVGRSLVETSTKFRPHTGRIMVEISTKFRPPRVEVWLKFQPNFNPPKGSTGHSFKQSSSEHKTIYIKFLWEHCSDNLLYCCFICALCHPSLYMYINRHIRTHERMQSQCIRVGPNHVRQTSPAT